MLRHNRAPHHHFTNKEYLNTNLERALKLTNTALSPTQTQCTLPVGKKHCRRIPEPHILHGNFLHRQDFSDSGEFFCNFYTVFLFYTISSELSSS